MVTFIGVSNVQLKSDELLPIAPNIESVPCLIISSIVPYDSDTFLTSVSVAEIKDDVTGWNVVTRMLPSIL